jgi:hypothetical protein
MENPMFEMNVGGAKIAAGLMDRRAVFVRHDTSHSHVRYQPIQVDEIGKNVWHLIYTANVNKSRIAGDHVGKSGHDGLIDSVRGTPPVLRNKTCMPETGALIWEIEP